jgi:hypothetical protein
MVGLPECIFDRVPEKFRTEGQRTDLSMMVVSAGAVRPRDGPAYIQDSCKSSLILT